MFKSSKEDKDKCYYCSKTKQSHYPSVDLKANTQYVDFQDDYEPCKKHLEEMIATKNKQRLAYVEEYDTTGIPHNYQNKKLDDLQLPYKSEIEQKQNAGTKKVIEKYIDNIHDMYLNTVSIVVYGGLQTDRTLILACIADASEKACIRKEDKLKSDYITTKYLEFESIVECSYDFVRSANKKYWDVDLDPDHKDLYVDDIVDPEVLLIDGFDISLFRDRENMVKNTISNILNRRNRERKLTIISSNCSYSEFIKAFPLQLRDYEQIWLMGSENDKPSKIAAKIQDITKNRVSNVN